MSRRVGRMSRGKNRGPFRFREDSTVVKKAHGNDTIDIAGEIKAETAKAYLFYDGKETVWLPKSQSEWDAESKTMTMQEWLAMEKGLI